jgi:hypothetical protein
MALSSLAAASSSLSSSSSFSSKGLLAPLALAEGLFLIGEAEAASLVMPVDKDSSSALIEIINIQLKKVNE